MASWIDNVLSILLDRSAEQLIGAVILALVLSSASSAVGTRLIRSRRDEPSRLTAVMFVLCLGSMLISGTYIRREYDPHRPGSESQQHWRPPGSYNPSFSRMASRLDVDGDGALSAAELAPDTVRRVREELAASPPMPGDPNAFRDRFGQGGRTPTPGPDGLLGEPGAARELHEPPSEDGGDPPSPGSATGPDRPPVAPTEEHP